jgi:hypothetical protein
MPEDPSAPERIAALEALFGAHVEDCSHYRAMTKEALDDISSDVKELVAQGNRAKGSADAARRFFGALPGLFWQVVMTIGGSLLTVGVVKLLRVM